MSIITVDRHQIELSNLDKILFPADGITKGDMVDYYRRIAPVMVPHIQARPLTMQRFPNGINHEGFFQKDASDYFPSWITTQRVQKKDSGVVDYVVCNDAATLVYLANQGCITPHVWLSTTAKLRYPDHMIFDLDPSNKDFSLIVQGAKRLKEMLQERGFEPFVMTTGSRGLHVLVALKPTKTFDAIKKNARAIAQELVDADPKKYTLEVRKDKRQGRVFVDYLRNSFGATAVAPYAIRPLPGAPIATPLEWKEVNTRLSPQQYTLKTIFKRMARRSDPWLGLVE